MADIIQPKPISGFPEFLPSEQIVFQRMMTIIRTEFERFGFSPIETPAVERKEVLTSKGGDEREIYALSRLAAELSDDPEEDSATDLALHFDLTVPLARYVSMYQQQLTFPFRRYQMQKVWRGERAAAGRYREFYQCDIDIVGRGKLGMIADAEIPAVIYSVFTKMGIGTFVIRVNNRKLLQGYVSHIGIVPDQVADVLRVADKLEKIGVGGVLKELTTTIGIAPHQAEQLIAFLGTDLSIDDTLEKLGAMGEIDPVFGEGVEELRTVVDAMRSFGVPDAAFKIDLGVVRGLDYYTGTIYETTLIDYPELGSICSGGRYENLAGYFSNEQFPGVGISIGLSRLIPTLLEKGVLKAETASTAPVLVTTLESDRMLDYLKIASQLRDANIATEVYSERGKFNKQMKYANKKGFRLVLIAGGDELSQDAVKIKNMVTGEESLQPLASLVEGVRMMLGEENA